MALFLVTADVKKFMQFSNTSSGNLGKAILKDLISEYFPVNKGLAPTAAYNTHNNDHN